MENLLKTSLISGALLLTLLTGCSGGDDTAGAGDKAGDDGGGTEVLVPANPQKTNAMKVYVHYMPWFVAPQSSGVWNHWTMSANALLSDESNLASHYHPLTGAYASNDDAILDYQCLLMKYAGVDGVMIDWYGTQQKNDYPVNEANTLAMKKAIERAAMKMAIVYEDATLAGLSDMASQARTDMRYLQSTYFASSCYAKVNGNPLLLVFGPQQLTTPAGWTQAFSTLTRKPQFIVLNGNYSRATDANNQNAQGEFLWVNANPSYNDAGNFDMYIGGAMPGFWDVYKEHGQGEGYTTYDRENGNLFDRQLAAAKNAGLEWLQVTTWNDYGEGTTIEPTREYGYLYLEKLQKFTGVSYGQHQLELVFRWYKARKDKPSDKRVARAYDFLNSLQPDKAEELIKAMEQE